MNKYNEQGNKEGYWEYEDENNSILIKSTGEVIKRPKPLIYKGHYNNGEKNGEWLVVVKHSNEVRERIQFINDKMNGEYIIYGVHFTLIKNMVNNIITSSDLKDNKGNKLRDTLYYN